MRILLALAAAVLALSVGMFLFWSAKPPQTDEVQKSGPRAGSDSSNAETGRPTLESPPAAAPAPPPDTGAGEVPSTHAPVPVQPVDFDAKYAGWSFERLAGAKAVVDSTAKRMFDEIVAERREAGKFEEVILAKGETFQSRAYSNPMMNWSEPMEDGRMRYRTIEIPANEYPAYEAIRLEQGWLTTKLQTPRKP